MGDLVSTSWPRSPTGPPPSFALLQQHLKLLRNDIAELTAKAEAAAERTARVLQSLRSQEGADLGSPNELGSQENELTLTLQDHPFARFNYHDNIQADPSDSTSVASQSARATDRAAANLVRHGTESPMKRACHAMAFGPVACPLSTKAPLYSTYEQSRIFLEVTVAVKSEETRAAQCAVVEGRIAKLTAQVAETTSIDVCLSIARQIVAYLRFLNLERVRRFIYEETRHVPQHCTVWWGMPSIIVEQALAQRSLAQERNDPMLDGIVALVLIHFGVFKLKASDSQTQHHTSKGRPSSRKRLAALLRRMVALRPDPEQVHSLVSVDESSCRIPALSVEALIAVTELCLQGVFGGATLCDILALFSLGDIARDVSDVNADMELLTRFLHEGLLPRAASIRATFADGDPIRDILNILESMQRLKEAKQDKQASTVSSVERPTSQVEETEWVPLERFPSSAVSS